MNNNENINESSIIIKRIDFFIRKKSFSANEMNTFPWPTSEFFKPVISEILENYKRGLLAEIEKEN